MQGDPAQCRVTRIIPTSSSRDIVPIIKTRTMQTQHPRYLREFDDEFQTWSNPHEEVVSCADSGFGRAAFARACTEPEHHDQRGHFQLCDHSPDAGYAQPRLDDAG